MTGYISDIERKTLENSNFREVLFTGPHSQLVVMSIEPGDEIGLETHDGIDQFIRVEAGQGRPILNGEEHDLADGSAVVIPSGTEHNIVNVSESESLKLYSVYSPPEHPDGTINKDKDEALEYEKEHHG
ncbi:MAG: cupin domain-containing protein [Pyrinomonadaceae bacterium]